jgi:hypothetical protein
VLYLGSDVTVDGWVDAMARTGARAAVVGVVMDSDREAAAEIVAALLARDVPIVALGGAAASKGAADLAAGAVVVPDRVVDAAATVADAVGRRRR